MMSKPSLKRPITPIRNGKDSIVEVKTHWSANVYECAVCIGPEGTLNLPIEGGSDNGEFAYFHELVQERITYLNGRLESGDVILEIQGQKVAGFTQRDVVAWLNHCCKSGNPVRILAVRNGFLDKDLRLYLNTRFPKGTPDYDLQNTVRDNLYLRTVPCTTRPPRDGEVNGVDYTFLTPEEFMALERSGSLLESGIYEGNHYGTPKPPKECPVFTSRPTSLFNNTNSNSILPGIHPSSEGKRRRNRSSVEAMTAKSGEPEDSSNQSGINSTDHNTGTSQWLDPRLSKTKKPINEYDDDELPYGWEKIDDPHYGTYYIDHVNKRTQYENPVMQAKKTTHSSLREEQHKNGLTWKNSEVINHSLENSHPSENENSSTKTQDQPLFSRNNSVSHNVTIENDRSQAHIVQTYGNTQSNTHKPPYVFTRNPSELLGEIVRTSLIKSARGFGFTIVGGDEGDVEEFLQIKAVVPHGPAWQDGKLQTGDVLVFINNICVLGYSHQDVVSLFQSIPPGETVHLEVCRGYPLPFDPDDPNTEIVTTVAVSNSQTKDNILNHNSGDVNNPYLGRIGTDSTDSQARSAKSMPDLSAKPPSLSQRHNSADLLSNSNADSSPDILDFNHQLSGKPEFLAVEIVKGNAGFGFTIADSVYGQKVKKILDRPRCKHLQEGDILIEINGRNIRGLAHTDVVQILKECTCGDAAHITIQRGVLPRVTKMKSADDVGVRRSASNNSSHSFVLPHRTSETYGPITPGIYRSKTPTADLYSSRDKESILVNRPKTPLVDTRHWPKSPVSDPIQAGESAERTCNQGVNPDSVSLSNRSDTFLNSRKQENHSFNRQLQYNSSLNQPAENTVVNRPTGFPNTWKSDSSATLRTAYSVNSDKTGVGSSWYTTLGKLRDTYWADQNSKELDKTGDFNHSNLPTDAIDNMPNSQFGHSHLKLPPPLPPHARTNIDDSYEDSVFSHGSNNQSWTARNNSFGDVCSSNNQYDWNSGNYNSNSHKTDSNQICYRPKSSLRNGPLSQSCPSGHYMQMPVCNGPIRDTNAPMTHQDINFHTMPMASSHYSPSGHSPSSSHYDSLTRRKHGTSFEHEHPSPVGPLAKGDQKLYSNNASVYNQQGAGLRPPLLGRVPEYVEMTVTLLRQESGFGFRIVGGTEEGSQVSIGHIVPGGAADLDGRLHTGDEIVTVDNQLVLNTSHHRVVQLMGSAAINGRVTLGVRRKISSMDSAYHTRSTESIYPYDVTVSRQENEGFGFVIISSVSRAGSTIGRIIEGSPADRCGQLHVGDRILAVNNITILNMHHGDIVNLIKDSGYSVTLTVGPPQDDTSSTTSASQRGEEQAVELDDQYHAVELHRGTRGFGFSIRGGREFQNMPLFVLRIADNGPAHQDGKLLVGDQIIEINGINTKNMTHAEAIELIRQGGSSVRLLVKRGNQIPQAIIDHPSPVAPGPPVFPLHSAALTANGPIGQSSPRDLPDHLPREYYSWGYEHR